MSLMIPIPEAMEELRCSEVTLKNMLSVGDLPGIMPGKEWVIPRVAFEEAVNELARQEAAMRRGLTPVAGKGIREAKHDVVVPFQAPEKKKPGRPRLR